MFTEFAGTLRQVAEAATTPHGLDRWVELLAPTWSSTEVRGRVLETRRQTPDTVTLTIAPNRNWQGFTAGQHTQLTVEIDGVRHTRCYSLANAATADRRPRVELTVKAQPGGTVSPWLVAHARPGLVVGLSPASGTFSLPQPRPADLLLVSGGSGITPVLAMLRTLCAEGHDRPVTFLHYSLTEDAMPYRDELAALAATHGNVRLVRVFTAAPGTGDLDGFADAAQLDAACPSWRTATTYLCGPEPLMASLRTLYREAGVSERLHTEAFTLAEFGAEAGSTGATVRFGASRLEVADDGRPLLLQAEAAGLAPAHGCRMGICHTCTRTLTSGTVRDLVTGETTDQPGGAVRICVSAPVSDVEIDL